MTPSKSKHTKQASNASDGLSSGENQLTSISKPKNISKGALSDTANEGDGSTLKRDPQTLTKMPKTPKHQKTDSVSSNNSSPEFDAREIKRHSTRITFSENEQLPAPSSDESYNVEEDDDAPVQCGCASHSGKELINKVYNISVNYLFECMYGHSEFCKGFWESRKFSSKNEINKKNKEFYCKIK